jgi:hypothetical protein
VGFGKIIHSPQRALRTQRNKSNQMSKRKEGIRAKEVLIVGFLHIMSLSSALSACSAVKKF